MLRTRGGRLFHERIKKDYEATIERLLSAPPDEMAMMVGQARALKAQLVYLSTAQSYTNKD